MRKRLLLFLWLLPLTGAFAQYTSKYGRFEVNEIRGCDALTVNLTILVPSLCDGANPCSMDFEGNNSFQSLTFTHTYTTPGTYWLRVLFQATALDSIQIQVFPDIPPAYELYTCGGNAVRFRVTDTNYSQYVVNFNDGSPDVVVPSGSLAAGIHTYATSGAKTVSVRGRNLTAADNCTANTQAFTAVASLSPPTLDQLTVTSSSSIQLDFTNQPNVIYRLEIARNNATTFQLAQNVYNTSTTTVSNLLTDDEYYCFRLGAFDPCNNTTVYSNTICSANFDLITQDNNNRLTWVTSSTSLPAVNAFDIERDNVQLQQVPVNQTQFDDGNVVCKTTYCYQLIHNYTNGSRSLSATKCGEAFSSTIPSIVANITASVAGTGVSLSWTQDPLFTPVSYSVAKSLSGGPFVPVLQTATQSGNDPAYITGSQVCYQISYTDVCDNASPASSEACVISLTGTLAADNSITLNWSDYTGWQNGVSGYVVEKYSGSGNLLQTFNTPGTTLTDNTVDLVNQVYVYVVLAVANDAGLGDAYSNQVMITKEPNLYYPTAFTPNGDGLNDLFVVYGQYIVDFNMRIFNRWGEMLFDTGSLTEGWNGTYNGSLMPEGTYVFEARLTDFAGREFVRSGTVVLLRKP